MKKSSRFLLLVVTIIAVFMILTIYSSANTSCDFIYTFLEYDGTARIDSYTGSATDLEIPSSIDGYTVTIIGNNAFEGNHNLISVTIPDTVTTIYKEAFAYCSNLQNIALPNSIETIYYGAFRECTNLENMYYQGTSDDWMKIIFDRIDSNPMYCAKNEYFNGELITNVILTESLCEINGCSFYNCTSLQSITIPNDVTVIGSLAFYGCNNIEDVYYKGSEEQWAEIVKESGNEPILEATIHYNYTPPFTGVKGEYFYKDDVRLDAYQLAEHEGDFYYISNYHKIVKDKTLYLSAERVEGFTYADGTPLKAGYYTFDEDGKMVMLNGVVGDYLYKDNIRFDAYQLVEYEGDFYYISNYHKIVRDKTVYLSAERVEGFTNSKGIPLKAGYYTFDADGKMVVLNGLVGDYFYEDNVRLDAYQLIEYEGDIYFISNYHKIVRDKTVYLSAQRVEGFTNADGTPLKAGNYTFDADGRLIKQ